LICYTENVHSRCLAFAGLLLTLGAACRSGGTAGGDAGEEPDAVDASDRADAGEAVDTVPDSGCETDEDCDNGRFCDGAETCYAGTCVPGTPPACDDEDPCTSDTCPEDTDDCRHESVDEDLDGYPAAELRDGTECGGTDCDDAHDDAHPGALEVCGDRVDQDCDGLVDGSMPWPDVMVSDPDSVVYGLESRISLAWSGSEFGLAWEDVRAGRDIHFTRISGEGAKLMPDVRVNGDGAAATRPSLVWTGSLWAVAWDDSNLARSPTIFLTLLDPGGSRIGGDVALVPTAMPFQDSSHNTLAWTGSEFGLAWEDEIFRHVAFARFAPDGTDIGEIVWISVGSTDEGRDPSLVWTGSEFGVAWEDERYLSTAIFFTRISADGVELGSDVQVNRSTEHAESVMLAWTGSEFGAAWKDLRHGFPGDVYFSRITLHGTVTGPNVRVTPPGHPASLHHLAWGGSEFGLTCYEASSPLEEIRFHRISGSGSLSGGERSVRSDTSHCWLSAVAWSGSLFGVAWQDARTGQYRIYFNLVDVCF
jgi:hypothetical protein